MEPSPVRTTHFLCEEHGVAGCKSIDKRDQNNGRNNLLKLSATLTIPNMFLARDVQFEGGEKSGEFPGLRHCYIVSFFPCATL